MGYKKGQYSLKRDLLKTYVVVILISIAVYCGLSISRNNISDQMEAITDNNLKISRLSLLIPERQNQVQPYLYPESEEKTDMYRLNNEIGEILTHISKMCENPTDDYLAYSRILSQVNGHYLECLEEYQKEEISSQMHYYSGAYLRTISDELKKYTSLLMAEYLNYSYAAFNHSMEQYKVLELRINLVMVCVVFASLIYMAVVSQRIWKFLNSVSDYTGHLSRHEWDAADMDAGRYREFNMVIKALNSMKSEINNYIIEMRNKNQIELQLQEEQLRNEKSRSMLKEAGLKMLQMQINPHFLFNTLNLIMRTVQMKENQTAVELIQSTARILRSSISIKSPLIPLQDELDNLEAYLYIQRLRYQDRIDFVTCYQIDCADTLMAPPIILQPLVENSILHGLKDRRDGGTVRISVSEKETCVEIYVSDNGSGFDQELLEKLEQGDTDRIGLMNVKKRLQLQFSRTDVFLISSVKGQGADIRIRIPKHREEQVL